MIIMSVGYIIVFTLFRFLRLGIGDSFYGAWPFLLGVSLGTQFVLLDLYLCKHFKLREDHLLTQHILFAFGWIVIAFFGITSTTSWFGKGFVMGIGLQLASRMIQSLREKRMDWLFWPIKRTLSESEKKWAARIFFGAFGLLTLLI